MARALSVARVAWGGGSSSLPRGTPEVRLRATSTTRFERDRSPPARTASLALGLGPALLIAGLLLLGGTTTAVGPRTTVFKAPYKGAVVSHSDAIAANGCGSAKVFKPSGFTGSSGVGGFYGVTRIPACKSPLGSGGSLTGGFSVAVPVKLPSGNHRLMVNWSDRIAFSLVIKMGTCATGKQSSWACYQSGGLDLNGYASVLDWTTGAGQYPSNAWAGLHLLVYNFTSCSTSGGCSTSASGGSGGSHSGYANLSWFINATGLNSSHQYFLVTSLSYDEYTSISATGTTVLGGAENSTVNVATLGNGARLTSISVV
jgi:hypothetical protein